MRWAITVESETGIKTHNIPFEMDERVYYACKKKNKWVVYETRVRSIWATNIVGVVLDIGTWGWHITEDAFGRIFENEDDAIDYCVQENKRNKIKVYRG